MIEFFLDPAFWATLAILIGLELALGVDNVVFVSLVMGQVPEAQRNRARQIGLAISVIVQIVLLFIMLWIAGVERPAFTLAGWSPSWGELAFLAGGLFLVYKAVSELHIHIETGPKTIVAPPQPKNLAFAAIVAQVAVINAVFSVDTIITAVGITRSAETIIIAIVVTSAIIYFATGPISAFIARHRSVRGLALAILLMIGGSLISEGLGIEPDPVLVYSAIGVAALILAIIKLAEKFRSQRAGEPETIVARDEPVLEPATEPAPIAPEPQIEPEPEPVRDEDALEVAAPDVQQSAPKRRAPRRKPARKPKASSQG